MGWIFITKFCNLSHISCYICTDINRVGFFLPEMSRLVMFHVWQVIEMYPPNMQSNRSHCIILFVQVCQHMNNSVFCYSAA